MSCGKTGDAKADEITPVGADWDGNCWQLVRL